MVDVKFSPSGDVLYAATLERVYRIDATTHEPLNSATAQEAIWWVPHPTLPRVYVTYSSPEAVVELDATTLAELRRLNTGVVSTQGLALHPDGNQVMGYTIFVSSSLTGTVELLDLATRISLSVLNVGGAPRRAAHPNGSIVVVQ